MRCISIRMWNIKQFCNAIFLRRRGLFYGSLSFYINGKNEGFDFVFEMQTVKNSMLRHGPEVSVFEDKPLIKVSKLDTSVHLAYITNGDHYKKIH